MQFQVCLFTVKLNDLDVPSPLPKKEYWAGSSSSADDDNQFLEDDSDYSIDDNDIDDVEEFSDEESSLPMSTCSSCGSHDVETSNQGHVAGTVEETKRTISRLQRQICRLKKAVSLKKKLNDLQNKTSGMTPKDLNEIKDIKEGSKDGDIWCPFMVSIHG